MNTKLLKKHGAELALRAYQLNREGEGPSTISIMLGVHFKTADGLINLGRDLSQPCPYKIGEAVIYEPNGGGSVSARVSKFLANYIFLTFAVPFAGNTRALVHRRDWSRITPFGNNLFVAL